MKIDETGQTAKAKSDFYPKAFKETKSNKK